MSKDTGPLAHVFILEGKAEQTGRLDDRANAFAAQQVYKEQQKGVYPESNTSFVPAADRS
jgi:hypothetical protein